MKYKKGDVIELPREHHKEVLVYEGYGNFQQIFRVITPGCESFGEFVGWPYDFKRKTFDLRDKKIHIEELQKLAKKIGILQDNDIEELIQSPEKAAEFLKSKLGYEYKL